MTDADTVGQYHQYISIAIVTSHHHVSVVVVVVVVVMVRMQAALGLASAMLHHVVAKTVEVVGLIGMYKTGCSGETGLVPYVLGSS